MPKAEKKTATDEPRVEANPELLDASKEELYEEAQKRDLEGRSKMDKEELREAVVNKCANCDADAIWTTPGTAANPVSFCAVHVPEPYRDQI